MIIVVDDDQESPAKYLTAVITVQPANVVGVIGGQAVFTFTFGAVIPAEFTFGWQIQTDGVTWGDLVETAGFYEGVATQTLTVKAINNYLASNQVAGTLNFRCRLLFAGAVPSFTDAASLTVAIYMPMLWENNQEIYVAAIGPGGGFGGVSNLVLDDVVGLPGALTYSWVRISGDASILIDSATIVRPSFGMASPSVGPHFALWRATISNGINSVITDPVQICIVGTALDPDVPSAFDFDGSMADGAEQSLPPTLTFVGPWIPLIEISSRRLTSPAITISTPALPSTTFTIASVPSPGSATALIFYCPVLFGILTGVAGGSTVWGGQTLP